MSHHVFATEGPVSDRLALTEAIEAGGIERANRSAPAQ